MTLEQFNDDEVVLIARTLSIHRVSLRRKVNRLTTGSHERAACIAEMQMTGRIVNKLQAADLQRIGVA